MPTRKRLLNITSLKKTDSLLTATQAIPDTPSLLTQFTIPAIGIATTTFIFSPTMRERDTADLTVGNSNSRATSDTFVRGFKETLRFVTTDGNEWVWRRICFSWFGAHQAFQTVNEGLGWLPYHFDAPATGYRRLFSKIDGGGLTPQMILVRDAIYEAVFKGTRNLDWTSPMTAQVDPKHVKIWYDKKTTIKGGNDESHFLMAKRWHPINKTLYYDDDDSGKNTASSPLSKQYHGMGDYFIMDIFFTAPADAGVQLSIGSDATYYWHER